MATRAQAKAAIDSAGVLVKSDIDNILPSGVDIVDGSIRFAPFRYSMILVEATLASATTLAATIGTNLAAATRTFVIGFSRRKNDGGKSITVTTGEGHSIRITFT